MPQMASITIKKADGVTDIVYNAQSPSAGDKIPAVWRATAAHAVYGYRPVFQTSVRDSGNKKARIFDMRLTMPMVVEVAGETVLKSAPFFSGTFVMPTDVPSTLVKELHVQFANLLKAALVQQQFEEGVAAS